ncbi:hypothetical protein BDV93DRAFT_525756 [Ceratobasidium sp. AG-I]|nr:hypothetical protein BDV93DRAFT_525756 [Ceratobasidium sp. AG-I]
MEFLTRYFPDLAKSGAQVDVVSSSSSERLHVYSLSFTIEATTSDSVGVYSFNLGRRGESVTNGLRLTRDKCYWLFAHQSFDPPSETDTKLLALLAPGLVLAVLPLTTDSYMGTLRGPMFDHERGSTFVRFERNQNKPEMCQAVIAVAGDLNLAVKSAVRQARVFLQIPESGAEALSFGSELFENTLTYCTWNSLQPPTPTTAISALGALEFFHAIGVRPATFLIDDAWQDVKSFRLQSFGSAAPFLDKFKTLGEAVKIAKEKYGVRNVGVWHTIQGYWQGVEPAKFASRYKLVKVTKDGYPGPAEPEGFEYHIPHPDSILPFFKDYYSTLREAGVTFTKCDNMASIDQIASAVEVSFTDSGGEVIGTAVDVPTLRKAYVHAVMVAAREHFGAENIIWCMGMTPRILLGNVGLSGGGAKRVVRNSDDYYPNEPDSHRYHIFTNVINALLLNNLDVQPDLDMFQTHPYVSPEGEVLNNPTGLSQASFHASFRVFGTGPVTITDVPLKSNSQILRKIVGDLSPGSTSPSVVVQASRPFTVLNDVFDPNIMGQGAGKGLKVYADNTIGIWNLQSGDKTVVEFVTPSDIAQALGLSTSTLPPVILYIQSSNNANERTVLHDLSNPLRPAAPVKIEIGPLGWATVSVAVIEAPTKQGNTDVGVACLGLIDKYLSSRGVSRAELTQTKQGGWTYTVHVRCSGTLGVWVGSQKQVQSVEAGSIGEKGEMEGSRGVEYQTTGLERGSKWIMVETKGRSVVTFQLA